MYRTESINFAGAVMCLGIPMQITEINGYSARANAKGIEREVNLFLLQDDTVAIGDFVMVHVGYAIQKMSPQEARSAWELYDEMLALETRQNAGLPPNPEEGHA
ncbi:MAG TPA: HypC/HybG/HupF family hydrogenase formation chaperone [Acidiferrobacterales bacterium]